MNHPKLAHKEEPVFNGLGVFSNCVDTLLRASEDPSALITELKQHWPRLSVLAISEWTSKQETETQHLSDRSQLQRSLENALNLVCNQNFATSFYKCFFDRRGWLPKIREEQRASKNEVDSARRAFERSVSVCGLCELLMRCDDVSRVEWWLDKARSFLADPHDTPMTGNGERLLKACSDRTELSDLLDELSFTRDSKFLTLQQLGHRPSPESSTVNVVFNLDRVEIPTFFALGSLTLELIDGSGDIMPHPETYLAFTAEWHDALAEVWNGKAQKWFPGKSLVWRLQMENFFEVIHGRSVQGSALAGLYCLSKRLEYPSELVISASIRNDELEKVSGISSNGSPGHKLEAIAEDNSLTTVIVARSTYAELTSHSLKKWERTNTKRLVPVETCDQMFKFLIDRNQNKGSKVSRRRVRSIAAALSLFAIPVIGIWHLVSLPSMPLPELLELNLRIARDKPNANDIPIVEVAPYQIVDRGQPQFVQYADAYFKSVNNTDQIIVDGKFTAPTYWHFVWVDADGKLEINASASTPNSSVYSSYDAKSNKPNWRKLSDSTSGGNVLLLIQSSKKMSQALLEGCLKGIGKPPSDPELRLASTPGANVTTTSLEDFCKRVTDSLPDYCKLASSVHLHNGQR